MTNRLPLYFSAVAALLCIACEADKSTTPDPTIGVTVSGKIVTTVPTPATQGVVVRLGTRATTSDASSMYRFDSVVNGSYAVAPELVGRRFTPASQTVVVAGASIPNIDFNLVEEAPINSDSIYMVRVQAGTFIQGNSKDQALGNNLASPRHQVTLTRSYFVGIHEVTQNQWMKVMTTNPSATIGPKHPVAGVAYDSVLQFCNRMSMLHGLTPVYSGAGATISANFDADGYRLPTESEWEFAALTGDTTQIPGLQDLVPFQDATAYKLAVDEIAWYDHSLDVAGKVREPQPVGGKKANAFGLYDMSGNINEWTYCQRNSYTDESKTDPCNAPIVKVALRGGHYTDDFSYVSVKQRIRGLEIIETDVDTGFRVVRTAK